MKTSRFLFTAALVASLVSCQDDTFVSNNASNNGGMNGKLVKSGLLGIGHGTNDAATRAYSIDGHFIWMPTVLTIDGKIGVDPITRLRSNQRIGFCWTGVNNEAPEYSAGPLSQKVYTNYEFEHVGWLDENATGVKRNECSPYELLNGGYIVGETDNGDVATWNSVPYSSENGKGTKYQTGVKTGVNDDEYPIGKYSNGILNLGSGLFKTENADVFEGEYLVYFPFNDGFTKGQIIAAQPDHFDIDVAENRFTTLSRYAFSIGHVNQYDGGQSLEKITTKPLSSYAGVRLYDSSITKSSNNIKKIIFYANETGFKFKQDLDAKKCVEALKADQALGENVYYDGQSGTELQAADVNAIYATLTNGATEYATVSTASNASKAKALNVYFPVLPQTIKGLTVVLINDKDQSCTVEVGDYKFESGKNNSIYIDLKDLKFENKYMVVDEATLFSALESIKDATDDNAHYTIQLLRNVRIENVMSHAGYVGKYGSMFFNKNITIMTECAPEKNVGISLASGEDMYIKSLNSAAKLDIQVPFTVEGAGCCESEVARLSVGGASNYIANVDFSKIINHGALALANVDLNPAYINVKELVNEYDEWAIDKKKLSDAAQLFLVGENNSNINISTLTNKGTITASGVTVGNSDNLEGRSWTEYVNHFINRLTKDDHNARTVNVEIGTLTNEVSTVANGGVININGFAELKVNALTNVSETAIIRTLNVEKDVANTTKDGRLVLTGASTNNGIIDNNGVINLEKSPMQNKGLLIDQLSGQLGGQYIDNGSGSGVERTYGNVNYKTDLLVNGMYVSKAATQERLHFTLTDEVTSKSVNVIEIVDMDVTRFNLYEVDPLGTLENKDVYISSESKPIVFKAFAQENGTNKAVEKYFGHCVTIRQNCTLTVSDGLLKTTKDVNVETGANFNANAKDASVDKSEITIGKNLNNVGITTNNADILIVNADLINAAAAHFTSNQKFTVKGNVETSGTFDSNGTPNVVNGNFEQKSGDTTFAFKTTTSIDGKFSCISGSSFLREALGTSGDYRATVNVGSLGELTGDNNGGGWPTVKRQ